MRKVHPAAINTNSSIQNLQVPSSQIVFSTSKCRFCGKRPQTTNKLSSPCLCPLAIHRQCIPDEMQSSLRGQIISDKSKRKYSCQKCKWTIRFQTKNISRCRSGSQICSVLRYKPPLCTWLILGTILLVILSIFFITILIKPELLGQSLSYNAVMIAVAIALGVLFILVIFFWCTSVCLVHIKKVRVLETHQRKASSNIEIEDMPQ